MCQLMCAEESSEEEWRLKVAVRPQSLYIPLKTKNSKFRGCGNTEGLRLETINCGTMTRNYMLETTEDTGYFNRFVCIDSPVSGNKKVLLFLPGTGRAPFSGELLWAALGRRVEGQRAPPTSAVSQVLQLKIMYQCSIFWGGMFWTPSDSKLL